MVAMRFVIFLVASVCLVEALRSSSRGSRVAVKGSSVATRYSRSLQANKDDSSEADEKKEPNFWTGLAQLMTMGAGAPSLGEFKEIDDRGRAIFELEANNLVDSEGNVIQTRAKFFENGYVADSDDDIKAPGFFKNLLSGGKAIRDWEEEREKSK
tara:strand:+ start:105 stop:569 length:465 start_codon:yes stop_codon:yes gene_type:complete